MFWNTETLKTETPFSRYLFFVFDKRFIVNKGSLESNFFSLIFQYMAESVPSLNRKRGLKLPVHGNERTMNLNHLILANITESAYFRTDLVQFRQFDELVDEIYYRANHLEPWEKVCRQFIILNNIFMKTFIVKTQ